MDLQIRKSGLKLILAGLLGVLFFWLTDPVLGMAGGKQVDNPIDAMNQAMVGTTAGIVGSGVVLACGVWIATRRQS